MRSELIIYHIPFFFFPLFNPARSSRKKCGRRRRLSCNRREQRILFVAGRDRAGRAGRQAGGRRSSAGKPKQICKGASKPTMQKEETEKEKRFVFRCKHSAPRCRSHSLCLAKKEWSGRTGGAEGKWREGVPLEEDDRRHKPSERPSV